MSSERKNGIVRFNCDGAGCHKNYEGEDDDFRAAWREAQAAGWVNSCSHERGYPDWKHWCPACGKDL